jgi:hypothetical protein
MIDGNAQSQSLQSTALEAAVAIIRSRPVAVVSVVSARHFSARRTAGKPRPS